MTEYIFSYCFNDSSLSATPERLEELGEKLANTIKQKVSDKGHLSGQFGKITMIFPHGGEMSDEELKAPYEHLIKGVLNIASTPGNAVPVNIKRIYKDETILFELPCLEITFNAQ